MVYMNKRLPLEEGEEIEIRSRGALSTISTGRWRLGEWIKTDRRILFLQGGSISLSVSLDLLSDISLCEREYSFGKKPCLKIVKRDPSGDKPLWLVSHDIKAWQQKLSERLKGAISEGGVIKLAKALGYESEKLLWFLYRKRHATIGKLAEEINAGSHMDVLNKIRCEINPAAQELIGRPVFIFRQVWADINYSWWFADVVEVGEPFYDIIDEGSFYRVIAETPEDAEVLVDKRTLQLVNELGFKNIIELPEDADGICGSNSYRNGILELPIRKKA